jgi:hypothetical protein
VGTWQVPVVSSSLKTQSKPPGASQSSRDEQTSPCVRGPRTSWSQGAANRKAISSSAAVRSASEYADLTASMHWFALAPEKPSTGINSRQNAIWLARQSLTSAAWQAETTCAEHAAAPHFSQKLEGVSSEDSSLEHAQTKNKAK